MPNIVTNIQIHPLKNDTGIVAMASVVFNNSLFLGSIAIRKFSDGTIKVSYPMRKTENDTKYRYYHPVTREVNADIEEAVLKEYKKVCQREW